jgi:hypothetical protein
VTLEQVVRARADLDRARRVLSNGREGASDEWIRAAERHVRLMEGRYRRAVEQDERNPDGTAEGRQGRMAERDGLS